MHTLAKARREHRAGLTLEVVGAVVAGDHATHTPASTGVITLTTHTTVPALTLPPTVQHPPVVPAAVPGVREDALAGAPDAGLHHVLGVPPVWGDESGVSGDESNGVTHLSLHVTCSPVSHLPREPGPAASVTARAAVATTAAAKLMSAPRLVIWNK